LYNRHHLHTSVTAELPLLRMNELAPMLGGGAHAMSANHIAGMRRAAVP
jgi:hypothetical protein